MNLYGIYFTHKGQVVRLPHNPSELPETQSTEHGQYNVLGIGPISVPRTPGQRKLSISSYFPGTVGNGLFSLLTYRPPSYYIQFFQDAMASGDPILYTPTRIDETGIPYAMSLLGYYVLLDKFDFREKGGETGDFYSELEATEYRDYTPGRVVVASTTASSAGAAASTASVRSIAVRAATTTVVATATANTAVSALRATVEPTRMNTPQQIVVGARCTLSGSYWSDDAMGAPEQSASGLQCTVARICGSDLASPVYIKDASGAALGWTKKSMLTVRPGSAYAGR